MSIHCNAFMRKVRQHPPCTWCPPPTRSWRGKCRFPFCSSSQSAVIQLEGFTGQHDPPCMLMLLLHISSCNYMILTTPLILFLALCFLALDHPGLPNYTKWGRTEENCSVSGKVVSFDMNFLFMKKCLKFSLSSLKQLQIDFFSTRPNQSFSPRLWSMPTLTFWGSEPLVSMLSIVLFLLVLL